MIGAQNKSRPERVRRAMLEWCCRQLSGLALMVALPENMSRRYLHDNSP